MAYEGYHYWLNWPEYIGPVDDRGWAKFRETGCMAAKTQLNKCLESICENLNVLSIPWEDWSPSQISERLPIYDLKKFSPPKRPDAMGFGEPSGPKIEGAIFFPNAGYVTDPQLAAHNARIAAELAGGKFLFNAEIIDILQQQGRGLRLPIIQW